MSGKFVRASKFRHVLPKVEKKENSYLDVKAAANGDGNFINTNGVYFSVATTGGGGPVFVHKLSNTGKFLPNQPTRNVHRAAVVDTDFSPFNTSLIATASEDCTAKVSVIPEGGLVKSLEEATATLSGHDKKLHLVKFHPAASNILGTSSYDLSIRAWDIEKQAQVGAFSDHPDLIQSFEWNANGSSIASSCKDRNIRIFDLRTAAPANVFAGFTGGKQTRVVWMDAANKLGAVGFDKSSMRQFAMWDPRNTAEPFHVLDLDQSAGAFMPFYDGDTGILFLAGKGDGSVKYFEINSDAPYVHYIDEHRSNEPQKGLALIPKRMVDTTVCEIARGLRLCNNWVEVVSFQVPRKADVFQKDIYPDAAAGIPSMTADEWVAGANADLILRSMKPGDAPAAGAAASSFVVGKSPAQELAELRALVAQQATRIAQLEDDLAKARA